MAAHRAFRVFLAKGWVWNEPRCIQLSLRTSFGGADITSGTAFARTFRVGNEPSKAFDASDATWWTPLDVPGFNGWLPNWIGMDFGSDPEDWPNIIEFAYKTQSTDHAPRVLYFQVTDDDPGSDGTLGDWSTEYVHYANIWANGETRTFQLITPTPKDTIHSREIKRWNPAEYWPFHHSSGIVAQNIVRKNHHYQDWHARTYDLNHSFPIEAGNIDPEMTTVFVANLTSQHASILLPARLKVSVLTVSLDFIASSDSIEAGPLFVMFPKGSHSDGRGITFFLQADGSLLLRKGLAGAPFWQDIVTAAGVVTVGGKYNFQFVVGNTGMRIRVNGVELVGDASKNTAITWTDHPTCSPCAPTVAKIFVNNQSDSSSQDGTRGKFGDVAIYIGELPLVSAQLISESLSTINIPGLFGTAEGDYRTLTVGEIVNFSWFPAVSADSYRLVYSFNDGPLTEIDTIASPTHTYNWDTTGLAVGEYAIFVQTILGGVGSPYREGPRIHLATADTDEYIDEIQVDSPRGFWLGNDIVGSSILDATNGRDLTLISSDGFAGAVPRDGMGLGGPSLVPAINSSLKLDGWRGHARATLFDATSSLDLKIAQPYYEAWLKWDDEDGFRIIDEIVMGAVPQGWDSVGLGFTLHYDHIPRALKCWLGPGSAFQIVQMTRPFQYGRVFHVVAQFTGAAIQIYVNDRLAGSFTYGGTINNNDSGNGAHNPTTGQFYIGGAPRGATSTGQTDRLRADEFFGTFRAAGVVVHSGALTSTRRRIHMLSALEPISSVDPSTVDPPTVDSSVFCGETTLTGSDYNGSAEFESARFVIRRVSDEFVLSDLTGTLTERIYPIFSLPFDIPLEIQLTYTDEFGVSASSAWTPFDVPGATVFTEFNITNPLVATKGELTIFSWETPSFIGAPPVSILYQGEIDYGSGYVTLFTDYENLEFVVDLSSFVNSTIGFRITAESGECGLITTESIFEVTEPDPTACTVIRPSFLIDEDSITVPFDPCAPCETDE